MTKKILLILLFFSLILSGLSFNLGQAKAEEKQQAPAGPLEILEGAYPGVGPKGAAGGATGVTISLYVARIINVALGFVGIILLVVILYGGFLWMTAGGNEEQVKKAKTWIKNGVIGIIIIVMAWTISYFVSQKLLEIGTPPSGQKT